MVPHDYEERVYAGVLGKIIAVYLGRPVEGWTYDRIVDALGEIEYYVNDRHDVALKNHTLIVTDDDISGTFVFPRALRDHGIDPTPGQVAQTWLDYLIENRAVLWWGGLGNSTEHTAYLRLRDGIAAPQSGSAQLNGRVVAEQVGAQIFIEGFAMTCPGDPERAADLVERAASVSHDGEALLAARVVAALTAQAFVEPDMTRLLDTAVMLIPKDSLIYQVIDDVRTWVDADADWQITRRRIDENYGYHRYGGNCHVIPNHAVVVSALAGSAGEFDRAMTIVTTSGWDTDSNAGNVGVIAGIRGGLAGLSGPDEDRSWRGPVADRMYLPSADSGAAITDAAREAVVLAAHGRARYGEDPVVPKDGARFHFALPGSVQGFTTTTPGASVTNRRGALTIEYSAIDNQAGQVTATATTPTFLLPDHETAPIYGFEGSPSLYPGQTIQAVVHGGDAPATCRLVVAVYTGDDTLELLRGGSASVDAGASADLTWTVPATDGQPVAAVGIEVTGDSQAPGAVHLDRLTWDGEPDLLLTRPAAGGRMWRRAWVNAVDRFDERWPEPFRIVQNRGTGLLIQGSRDWADYETTADVTPHVAAAAGLAGRVQGLHRYVALELAGRDSVRLVQVVGADRRVLAEHPFAWEFGDTYRLGLRFRGHEVEASVDGGLVARSAITDALDRGSVALLITEGRTATTAVTVQPSTRTTSSPTHHPSIQRGLDS